MASSSRRTIPAKNGDEVDAFSPWRKMLSSFARPGTAQTAKRSYRRRERTGIRAELNRARHHDHNEEV